MTMELFTALVDVMLFIVATILFARIYFSSRRSERSIVALTQAFEADGVKRQHHRDLMKVEIEALNRTKQELDLKVEEFKTYYDKLTEQQNKEGDNV